MDAIKYGKNALKHKKSPDICVSELKFQYGGDEGNRTPVCNPFHFAFYTFSLS